MFRIILFIPALMSAILLIPYLYMLDSPPLPKVDLDEWWGAGSFNSTASKKINPFKVRFTESMIKDIKGRLRSHHYTPPLQDVAFEYGFNSDELLNWVHHWTEKYPFRERVKFMNKYPQFTTNIQGLDIHFVRVKPKVPSDVEVLPLLLLHGWPGSVLEFYDSIPHLTSVQKDKEDKKFALDIIAPTLPGFGFSSASVRARFGSDKIAVVMRNLMHRLGFEKYYIQGGDWGAQIGKDLVTFFPEDILGYHTNLPFLMTRMLTFTTLLQLVYPFVDDNSDLPNSTYAVSKVQSALLEESGYFHLQTTKPDTIGVAFTDSPAGLAAYMLEKYSTLTRIDNRNRPDGGLTQFFTRDQLLDIITIYYITNSMTSAMRTYAETFNLSYLSLQLDQFPSSAPTISLQSEHEIIPSSSSALKIKYPNLIRHSSVDNAGHFLALERPERFAEIVIEAVVDFRVWHKDNNSKR